MALAQQHRFIARVALPVAACFCLLSMVQVARSLRCTGLDSAPAFADSHQHLTRHVLQEVSPRNAQPRAPYAVGLLPVVAVIRQGLLPRMAAYVLLWPMKNWPIHRRLAPAGADNPEPA